MPPPPPTIKTPSTASSSTPHAAPSSLPSSSSLPPPPSTSTSHLRILILEPSPSPHNSSLIPPLLQTLTSESPVLPPPLPSIVDDCGGGGVEGGRRGGSEASERISYAGYTTHPPLRIRTRYFDCRVGIWCDEVPLSRATALPLPWGSTEKGGASEAPTTRTWLTQMLSPEPEAREVRAVVGALVLALPVEDALQVPPASHKTASAQFGNNDDDEDDVDGVGRNHPWGLKEDFLDIIECVNTLRETIEDEKARSGAQADVGAVILLQGSVARAMSMATSAKRLQGEQGRRKGEGGYGDYAGGGAAAEEDTADALVEAVEEQLLTERAILGWDVVAWDPTAIPPTTATNTVEPTRKNVTSDNTTTTAEEACLAPATHPAESNTHAEAEEAETNIYGEKTGLARLKDLLHNLDWSAIPAAADSPLAGNSSRGKTDPNADEDAAYLDLDFLADEEQDEGLEHALLPSRDTDRKTKPLPPFATTGTDSVAKGGEPEDEEEEEEGEEAMQVEHLQSLVQRAMAIREAGAGMERGERERYARRMVGRLMRDGEL